MKTQQNTEIPALDEDSIARLKHINGQLDTLQSQIHELAKAYRILIGQTVSNMGLPVDDIHTDAELDFYLSPADLRYDPTFEQSDNLVCSRTLHSPESPHLLNFGIDEASSLIGPQGWLFHDLTEHDYGQSQPKITPADLLRVGEVNAELVIRHSIRVKLASQTGSGLSLKHS
jgi:hypothetical protein